MNNDRLQQLTEIQQKIHYTFTDVDLLSNALTHRSYVNENPNAGATDNERLEFLGDAVLGLCVSDLLIRQYTDIHEGALSKLRSLLVNEKPLADLSLKLGLGECLLLGRGEEHSGGRAKESLLANAFEALVAAVYLDSGFQETKIVLEQLMNPLLTDQTLKEQCFDYKTAMQEYCQKKFKCAPRYSVISESGPDHDKVFEIEVRFGEHGSYIGQGKSKKDAQKQAAQKAWESLQHERNG